MQRLMFKSTISNKIKWLLPFIIPIMLMLSLNYLPIFEYLFQRSTLFETLFATFFISVTVTNYEAFKMVCHEWIGRRYILDAILIYLVMYILVFFTKFRPDWMMFHVSERLNIYFVALVMNANILFSLLFMLTSFGRKKSLYLCFRWFSFGMAVANILYFRAVVHGISIYNIVWMLGCITLTLAGYYAIGCMNFRMRDRSVGFNWVIDDTRYVLVGIILAIVSCVAGLKKMPSLALITTLSLVVLYLSVSEVIKSRYYYKYKFLHEKDDNEKLKLDEIDQTLEIEHINQALLLKAHTDALTGLYNRVYTNDLMQVHIEQGRSFSLFYLDLDNFKPINDLYGHLVGDELLKSFASKLYTICGMEAKAARFGGDEFVLVVETVNLKELQMLADKIFMLVNTPFIISGITHNVGVSIGISFYPEVSDSSEELLKYAEIAMYRAKRNPNDQKIVKYSVELFEEVERRTRIKHYLIEQNFRELLTIYYQPIFSVDKDNLEIVEAKLRWVHEREGEISPEEFIPIAEELGIAFEMSSWHVTRAITDLKRWGEKYQPELKLSLVIAPTLFSIKEFVPMLISKFTEIDMDAHHIMISISEHNMMQSLELLTRHIETINAINIGILIDDFGVGYTSLSYLKQMKIAGIKISHELIENIALGSDDMLITNAIIMLAHGLALPVVAKGVRTNQQLSLISETTCDYYQGFEENAISASDLEQKYFTS